MISLVFCVLNLFPFAHAEETKLQFDQNVNVYQPSSVGMGQAQAVNAGADTKFDGSRIYWIESKGFVPMLLLPQNGSGAKEALKLKLPEVAMWPSATQEKVIGDKLGLLMDELNKFQVALRGKHLNEAEQSYSRMVQIADIEYLQFFKASLRFAQGDLAGAKEAVTRALQRYPNNEQGQRFLKSLERGG